ncbi:VWA domain-containing protein [Bacillus vallismortis]|uniref:VWA domain-containing protein n=1 Tax=Bacillus vallismortis TaxID=72361 RepID=UPI002090EEFD|nr:VWA domain-containing protein [Bacillus vallismortis]MCO4849943.1 VWA domain-containing protein [Bacillus vallismortis]
MDKLQEIKNRFSIATSLYKKQIDVNWATILEDQEFLIESVEKQREIIEENKRQQEVTVHQFRQAQGEIQRLTKENDRFRKAFHLFANMKTVRTAPELVIQSYSRYAKELLEGRGMEGDAE